jgi:hypothetical protein
MLDVVLCDGAPPSPSAGRTVNVWRDDHGRPFAEARTHGDGYRVEWCGLGTLTFARGSLRARLWPEPGLAPAAIRAALHIVEPVILQALGRQALHASAVRVPHGVIAFCGLSGSGKSTLAFALGQRTGLVQIADDAMVLEAVSGTVVVTPLPFRKRLRDETRAFFGEGRTATAGDLAAAEMAPLRAVFTLEQSPRPDTLEVTRIPGPSAFAALLPHAHCFDDSDRAGVAAMVEAYLTMAGLVPVYRLTYSPDFSRIGQVQDLVMSTVAGDH